MTTPVPEDQVTGALALLGSDLGFLLDEHKISIHIQARLALNGVTELDDYVSIDDKAFEVRKALRKDLGIDPGTSPHHRSM